MIDDSNTEFEPLPLYPFDRRPSYYELSVEEVATALYLSAGELEVAAEKLRIDGLRLIRAINRSPRLLRLHQELASLLNDKVHREYIKAFASDDDRRREWAASKVAATKQFQGHPLAPNSQVAAIAGPGASATRIIISWDDGSVDIQGKIQDGGSPMIEGEVNGRGSSDSGSE